MRVGFLYAFIVILNLLIVSSERTNKEQARGDISTDQPINFISNDDCIIHELSLCLDKNFSDPNFIRRINTKYLRNAYNLIFRLYTTSLKLLLTKSTDLKPIKQKPFRLKLHYTSEKKDNYHLA